MNRHRKIVIGVGIVSGVLLLLTALLIAAPKLIAWEAVKDEIRTELSETLGVDLNFRRIEIGLVPVPRIHVYHTTFNLPEGSEAVVEEVTVHPEILPLLIGRINLRELIIRGPALAVTLDSLDGQGQLPAKLSSIAVVVQRLFSTAEALPRIVDSHIEKGSLELLDGQRRFAALQDVKASLRNLSGKAQFEVNAMSAAAESLSLVGSIDTKQQRSRVQLRVAQAQLPAINGFFAPDSPVRAKDGIADLSIALASDQPGQMRADIDVGVPTAKLAHEQETVEIRRGGLKGGVDVDNESVTVSVSELRADQPKMQLSATLTSALGGGPMRLALKGADIDVRETRQAALALGKNSQLSRALFEVLRAGTLPSIALRSEGHSFHDLGNFDNLLLQGQLRDAEIALPHEQLTLASMSADYVLSHGTLEAQNLEARLGNSWIQNGRLKQDLFRADKGFQLQAVLRADLSKLPSLLTQIIPNAAIQNAAAQLGQLRGEATGNLLLTKAAATGKVRVQASNLQLTADYPGMPLPLQIGGGEVSYGEHRFGFAQLKGSLGKSVFSSLTGRLQLGEKADIEITSGRGRLYLAEIIPWLGSLTGMAEALTPYRSAEGTITLSSIRLRGPPYDLQKGHFSLSGRVENLVLRDLPKQPGPLTIRAANFEANRETLSYSDGRLSLLDAAIKLSGTHHRYLEGFDKDVTLAAAGQLGPRCLRWVASVLGLPPWLEPRPLTLSSSNMNYQRNGVQALSASWRLADNAQISAELRRSPEALIVKKLAIEDDVSRATVKLQRKNKRFDVSFSGKLYGQTLDQLLQDNSLLDGWIDGDFQASIATQALANSRVEGNLTGRGLVVPGHPQLPLTVNGFVIGGKAGRLFVDWADLSLAEMDLKLSGKIEAQSEEQLRLDMTVAADTLNLDQLLQALRTKADGKGGHEPWDVARLALQGRVRLKADRLVFDDFTWVPFRANISSTPDGIEVTMQDAALCGISMPGTASLSRDVVQLDLKLLADDQDLGTALNCLSGEFFKADGQYTLRGQVRGRGTAQNLFKNLSGHADFSAKDGRIYRDDVLFKALEFVNAGKLFEGRADLEKIETRGFRYRSANVLATLQAGKVRYEQAALDANPMVVAAAGEHDLLHGTLRFDLLVAPLVPLDRLLEDIPVVGGILGTLDVVPVTVSGTYDDLAVHPLHPAAVSYQLRQLLKNIAEVPIRLIHGRGSRGVTTRPP